MPIDDFLRELNLVDESVVKVSREPESAFLTLIVNGKRYEEVTPRLPFPLTNPDFVIFSRFLGGEWVDLFMIRDKKKLDPGSLSSLNSLLSELYFIPVIKKVKNLSTTGDEFVWDVITDRGARKFSTRGRRNIINDRDRLILIDVDNNVYVINDPRSLDKESRSFIERFL